MLSRKLNQKKIINFWITPLLAGSFLTMGYYITKRTMIQRGNPKEVNLNFQSKYRTFPGQDISTLKNKLRNNKALEATMKRLNNRQRNELEIAMENLTKEMIKGQAIPKSPIRKKTITIKSTKINNSDKQAMYNQKIMHEIYKSLPKP